MTEIDKFIQAAVNQFVNDVPEDAVFCFDKETERDIIFLFVELANSRIFQIQNNENFDHSEYEAMSGACEDDIKRLVKTYMDIDLKKGLYE